MSSAKRRPFGLGLNVLNHIRPHRSYVGRLLNNVKELHGIMYYSDKLFVGKHVLHFPGRGVHLFIGIIFWLIDGGNMPGVDGWGSQQTTFIYLVNWRDVIYHDLSYEISRKIFSM